LLRVYFIFTTMNAGDTVQRRHLAASAVQINALSGSTINNAALRIEQSVEGRCL
jgi:hypothetical protein